MDQRALSPYGPQPNAQQNPYQSPPNLNIVLTPEEIKILNECRSEAIYQRGLPLGAAVAAGCYYMMNKGVLKKNVAGVVFSGLGGFLFGTLSYRGICMEKLLSLPNSPLKDRILAAQGTQPQVRLDVNTGDRFFDSILPSSDAPPQDSSLDIEPYHSNQSDFYDSRPMDAEAAYAINPPLAPPAKPENYTTYDDLRRHNREDYIRTTSIPSGPRGPAPPPSSSLYSPPSSSNVPLSPGPDQSYGAPSPYNRRSENAKPSERTPDQPRYDEFRW